LIRAPESDIGTMFDSFLGAILETLLEFLWWLILWPVALIVSTPFVLLYAALSAMHRKQRFSDALSVGYASVSDLWEKCAF
jgi:hypothetical protein